jgi:hypothetical protein
MVQPTNAERGDASPAKTSFEDYREHAKVESNLNELTGTGRSDDFGCRDQVRLISLPVSVIAWFALR